MTNNENSKRSDLSLQTGDLPPVEPPADVPEIQRGNWFALPHEDPVTRHLAETLWTSSTPAESWELSRLSSAAYVYRETSTGWSVVAKFYAVKTGSSAHDYAVRERDRIREIQAKGLADEEARPVEPLGLWRGVLFLEYIPGLTLENIISVRHSQPGRLNQALRWASRFLAKLHVRTLREEEPPEFSSAVDYAHGVVRELAKYGVLHHYPIAQDGLRRLIDRWADRPQMVDFMPSLVHRDTTTTNFVFPDAGGVVVVDWERLYPGDPAFDLGRLMAEVTHSINQHGGSVAEAESYLQNLVDDYCRALPEAWDGDSLVNRARFYRASSTLRIARNGWVSRLDRTALVAQAMALLAD
jgi:aminoglycoside phosphotransferase (APT) family kinase protein